MVEVSELTKYYGRTKAVNSISFKVEKGEIIGLLGVNGAGKTTTMNMMTGYLPSNSGTVKICGYDIMKNPKEAKKNIGYLPEQPPLYMDMTVLEYLNFVSELKGVDKVKRQTHIYDIMETVKVIDVKKRLIKNLSKGYRQRVGLAQALIGKPKVLILDEPTVGLDPKQIIEIRNLIKELSKEHTVILSSHILTEVNTICDRVIIINKGDLVAIDTPENLTQKFKGELVVEATIEGDRNKVIEIIKKISSIENIELKKNNEKNLITYVLHSPNSYDIRKELFFSMAAAGYPILELKQNTMSLEDVFLQLTEETFENLDDNTHIDVIEKYESEGEGIE